MKKLYTLFVVALAAIVRIGIPLFVVVLQSASAASPKDTIRELILDEHTVYEIPIGIDSVTTISFPGPISALDGASLTIDGKAPGKFQLAYKPGNYFFSVRSLGKNLATNLNVVWNRKTYVLKLADSSNPVLSVIFKVQTDPANRSRDVVVTPARLLGLMDKAKAYPFLKEHHPDSLETVKYSEPNSIMQYSDIDVVIAEVFRFDEQDTLLFRLVLKNKTDREIYYDPQGFSLRVGDRAYSQSISDASGVVPPNGESPAYFAVTGTPNGGRNDLSLKNEFTVLVTQLTDSEGLHK